MEVSLCIVTLLISLVVNMMTGWLGIPDRESTSALTSTISQVESLNRSFFVVVTRLKYVGKVWVCMFKGRL